MIFDTHTDDRKVRVFALSPAFLAEFEAETPPWGFGGLGHFTFKRTYARRMCECAGPCKHPTEEWWQTCQRVVEGVYNIQKIHCRRLGVPWNEPKAQGSAQEMYRRLFTFKWTPPGRGLWMMGTDLVYEKGGASLNNCGFTSTDNLNEDFASPFCFLMDMSMLGVGVGGDTKGAGKAKLQAPLLTTKPFVVEDSREGWVALARTCLNAFHGKGRFPTEIDFRQVRPRGEPIRGFGGKASGPNPLAKLVRESTKMLLPKDAKVTFESSPNEKHENEVGILYTSFEGLDTATAYRISSGGIADLFNMVGACVVAGGVRRSAEILLGDPDDQEFCNLKDNSTLLPLDKKKTDLERALSFGGGDAKEEAKLRQKLAAVEAQIEAHPLVSHRWASNNSVFGTVGMDYSDIARRIAANGEPGVLWLANAQKFGRMGDPADNKDWRAAGVNPCSEQVLESWELCTLVETYPAHHDDYEDYERTLKFAYLYAKTVTLVPTHFEPTNAVMNRNRRIGCSVSGIRQAIRKVGRREFFNWCDRGYGYIGKLDRIYSEWLGTPLSIRTTSVKPSGTVSLLAGATPGVHAAHSEFYIRNIRVAGTSGLVEAARKAGYKVEEDRYVDDTWVISFPVRTENYDKGKRDLSIWEQFALVAAMQRYWSDNSVSATITFRPEEADQIQACLEVFEDGLKSVSLLPLNDSDHGYVQAPYIEISEDEYNALTAAIKPLDFSGDTHEYGAEDKFCTTDVCMLNYETEQATEPR